MLIIMFLALRSLSPTSACSVLGFGLSVSSTMDTKSLSSRTSWTESMTSGGCRRHLDFVLRVQDRPAQRLPDVVHHLLPVGNEGRRPQLEVPVHRCLGWAVSSVRCVLCTLCEGCAVCSASSVCSVCSVKCVQCEGCAVCVVCSVQCVKCAVCEVCSMCSVHCVKGAVCEVQFM